MKIDFIENKIPRLGRVAELLDRSAAKNHWANRGPLYQSLADQMADHIAAPNGMVCVPVANGGIALEAMARLLSERAGRRLRWLVSAYSFWNLGRGYFHDVIVADSDADGLLDLDACNRLEPGSFDGVIVTNPFGLHLDFPQYQTFADQLGIPLLIDNASGLHRNVPDVPWQSFSLHQTKPYGVGEGGIALVPESDAQNLYELLDYKPEKAGSPHWFTNGKLSDISCAFHIDRLERVDVWAPLYEEQKQRVVSLATQSGFALLSHPQAGMPMASVPLVAPHPVSFEQIAATQHMTCAKYYKPLANLPFVNNLFARLANVPCHPGLATLTDGQILQDLELIAAAQVRAAATL